MGRKYKPGYYEIKPGARKGLINIHSYAGENIFIRIFKGIINFIGKALEIIFKIILVIIIIKVFSVFDISNFR